MKIGIFCTNNYPAPPPEDVVYANQLIAVQLADGLAKQGVEVTSFAPEGSQTKAHLETFGMKPFAAIASDYPEVGSSYRYEEAMLAKIYGYAKKHGFDLIHAHLRPFSVLPIACSFSLPTVLTVHDPLSFPAYEALDFFGDFGQIFWIGLSQAHTQSCSSVPWFDIVYNGIDIESWPLAKGGDYLAWVGRVTSEKGPHLAIQVAQKTGMPLKLAGFIHQDDESSEGYFDKEIKPHLSKKIEFLGKISSSEVAKLYQGAKALLMPIQWEEPFGLVMVEAMACGTPVVAFNRGSVAEIIVDSETGFVVEPKAGVDGLIAAVEKIDQINRLACRRQVEKKFTLEQMVVDYQRVYEKILSKNSL